MFRYKAKRKIWYAKRNDTKQKIPKISLKFDKKAEFLRQPNSIFFNIVQYVCDPTVHTYNIYFVFCRYQPPSDFTKRLNTPYTPLTQHSHNTCTKLTHHSHNTLKTLSKHFQKLTQHTTTLTQHSQNTHTTHNNNHTTLTQHSHTTHTM